MLRINTLYMGLFHGVIIKIKINGTIMAPESV